MEMERLSAELQTLQKEEHRVVYTSTKGVGVTVKHTGKISDRDYAVGLLIPGRPEFNPTHIRLLIDLYIKRESNARDFQILYKSMEEVFKGVDPNTLAHDASQLNFPMQLDEAEVNLYLTQLLMIEQDLNYGPGGSRRSNLDLPREFLMRFIRWIAAADAQIDRIISTVARKYPAPNKYGKPIKLQ